MPTKSLLSSFPHRKASFIEPMECSPVSQLREGSAWIYEIKFDGYRAIAVKSARNAVLYSRRRKLFNRQYPQIVAALADLPNGTVVDGEVVALDDEGRPNFSLLQHARSQRQRIVYFVFDLLVCENRDLTGLPLSQRQGLLRTLIKPRTPLIRLAEQFAVSADQMIAVVRQHTLEGVVAKRKDSRYEAGRCSGSWIKYRVNRSQEFVIGGFIPGPYGVDSLIVGYYRGKDLFYAARTRNGLVPATRRQVFEKIRPLISPKMPFENLPENHKSRWGESLTAKKMKECVWVKPKAVAQIEFLEWTPADRLRHSKFIALREDKDPSTVVKEHAGEA